MVTLTPPCPPQGAQGPHHLLLLSSIQEHSERRLMVRNKTIKYKVWEHVKAQTRHTKEASDRPPSTFVRLTTMLNKTQCNTRTELYVRTHFIHLLLHLVTKWEGLQANNPLAREARCQREAGQHWQASPGQKEQGKSRKEGGKKNPGPPALKSREKGAKKFPSQETFSLCSCPIPQFQIISVEKSWLHVTFPPSHVTPLSYDPPLMGHQR